MTDLPTPNTTQPYILQQYDRSSNTEHNTTVYITTIWPIFQHRTRSTVYITTIWPIFQHRTQHNRIYYNNMKIGHIAVIYTVVLCSVLEDRSYCCNIYGCVVFGVGTPNTTQPYILQQYDRSSNTMLNTVNTTVYITTIWPIFQHRTQHNRIYYNNMTDLPTPNTTQPYILQQYDRSSNTEHNTTVYITTIWPIFQHRTQHNRIYYNNMTDLPTPNTTQPYILQQYDRSSNTEHNTTVYITTIWPIFQHRTQHNRIYYNNMTDLPTPNTTQPYILQQYDRSSNTEHNTTVYITTIWPIFQHRTQHNRIYYNNMTDLPTPNTTQPYILQQYDRSSNTEHNTTVYITTIWPIFQHRTQHNRIYYNNMTDLPTPNTTQPYILQQYDRSSNTEHNTTVYITTIWPIFQHRTQHNRIYYNNMTDLPTPNTTQPYILQQYDRSSNTEHNTTVYITTIWPIFQHRTQHNRIYYNNMTDLPTPNTTQPYILQQYDRSSNTEHNTTVYITTIWPIFQHRTQHNRIYYNNMTDLPTPNTTQPYILQQYDRSSNTEHNTTVYITTIWPIFQHRTQHNRIYYNNMTDLPTPNTTQPYILQQYDRSSNTEHNTTVYITTIWPIFQHRTQHNRIYYNNMTDLPTPNTTQPYILQQYDRSSNTEHNTTVYITTIWPIFQHRTQHNRIYYNNMTDLPTPNTTQPYILQQYDRSSNTEHNTTVYITTIWPIFQHRTQHNRIYYNNMTDLPTPNTTQPYILQQYDRSSNTEHNTTVYITTIWPIFQHRTQHNRIYYNNMTDLPTPNTTQPYILQQYDRSSNTEHNTTVYITTIWPIFQHRTQHNRIYYNNMTDLPTPNTTQPYILQQYDRSSNTEHNTTVYITTIWPIFQHRTQHNRIYYNNMTDLPTPNTTQPYILQQYDRSSNTEHNTTVYITTIWPIFQHRTQHNRIYYNNMTDLPTPNTTQPYILQQYDRSSNTEHNTTVYITTIWPIFQHRTQHNRIYYNNMTDLPTPNTTQPYILQQYDRSSNTEHNTTVYITTIWPIFQHRTQHNRIYYNNMTDLPTPNTTQPYILQQYDRSSNTEHNTTVYITTIWPIFQHRTQHNRIYYNNMTDLPTPNTTQPYILQQYDRSSNTEHNTTVYITTIWPIFQHRTQHNRIYYNNMTDLPTPNTTQPYILQQYDRSSNTEHNTTVYITTIWPIFQHRTQHNRIYYNNMTDLPTPNTTQPYILQQYDRSSNTEHNTTVYITTIWPIFQHRTQHNRIYYNNMTDLPTPNTTQPYILQQYDRSSNTEHNTTVYITTIWPIFQHRTQHNRIYYNNMTDLPTPNTTQPYILQQYDRSSNTEHNTTVYITTIWPIFQHRTQHNRIYYNNMTDLPTPNTTQPYILQQYDRSSNTEHNTTVYITTIWPIFQHRTQHNRIYYNNMTDLPTPNTTQPYILQQYDRSSNTEHNTTVYITTIWPIFQHRTQHNRIYYNNMTDLPTPNTTQPYILQQYDRSSNTEHNTTVYITTIWPIFQHRTQHNRIYYNNMTDLPTPNTTQPYILQQYDRSSNTEHNTTVYITTIWPIFQHRTQHNRIYYNNMTDLPTPNTTQPYILQQYDRSSNTEHNTTVYITTIWPIFQHRTQHNRIYYNNMTDLPTPNTTQPYILQQYDRSSNTEHNTTVYITTIWPIFQHRTQHNRIYYNNMTDLPTPNTTQPYILQQYDRSSNTEHNTTVYITTIWPIFQHRTQHNRIYYNNMTDLPTPNTTQPYILQQYDRSSNTEHNTTVYITTIWPIFQHRTQHNRIYYNNMTDLPTPNTTQPYILQQYDRSSNTEHNTTVYITTIWPIFQHRTQHNRIYYNNMTDLPTPNTTVQQYNNDRSSTQPYILQQYDRSSNTEHNTTVHRTQHIILQQYDRSSNTEHNTTVYITTIWPIFGQYITTIWPILEHNTTVYITTIWPIFQHRI